MEKVFLGIDVGSVSTNIVGLDEQGTIVSIYAMTANLCK
jgi:activator of 2-hydroxyglutaryl-CoA dehydratase